MTSAMAAPAAGAAAGGGCGEVGVADAVVGELLGALDVGDDSGDPAGPLEQAATSADAAMTRTSRMATRLAGGPPTESSAARFANVG